MSRNGLCWLRSMSVFGNPEADSCEVYHTDVIKFADYLLEHPQEYQAELASYAATHDQFVACAQKQIKDSEAGSL